MLDTYGRVIIRSFMNDKQTQVNSHLIREYEPKTPPNSGDEDKEGFVSRNVRRGFSLAEFALNTSIMGANAYYGSKLMQ